MPVQICNIGEEICIILQCEGTKENKCKWSVPKNNLPASLQLEETTGKIWGTCVEECLKTVTIKVEDVKNGMYTYGNITFYIRNKIQAFEFLTKSLPSAYVGENYHQQIFCEGGIKPYCFYVDSLPHGMECSLNGIISGTPTVSGGCFPITIQATDAKETKIEQFLWLEMKEGKKERRKEGIPMTSELCYTAEQLQKGIILDIPKDFYVLWEYTTQAAYEILLKMTDKNTQNIYMDEKRRSIEIEPFCHGIIEKVISDGVELCIDIPETRATFDCRVSKLEIKNATDDLLAISYTIMVEDGCDEDYNDLLLHVTAWKYKF